MTVINPAFSNSLPDDVKECVRKHRTFAEIIQGLAADHSEHVEQVEATGHRINALGAKIDAACAKSDDYRRSYDG